MLRGHVIAAIFRRDVGAYFRTATGYVFITVFVLLGGLAAFAQQLFFDRNLANLDTLTAWFPALCLFFLPAVTMGSWAEERRQGTHELLLTLPATELELVLGKYLALCGIFAIALAFSLSHVIVLFVLGSPDLGLLFATYVGYGVLGATLLAFGMLGSLAAGSATTGFIFGALLVGAAVFVDPLVGWVGGDLGVASPLHPFREAARGIVTTQTVVTAALMAGAMLFLAVIVLRARRRGVVGPHGPLRFAAVLVGGVALGVLAGRFGFRGDITAEGLTKLSAETRRILDALPSDEPVRLHVYLSPANEVPRELVATREAVEGLAREFAARSGGRIVLALHEAPAFSEAAQEASEKYGIEAVTAGDREADQVVLGLAAVRGAQQVVLPFLFPGLSPEYEITRAIRVVAQAKRKRVGVLATDFKLLGGFDMNRMAQNPPWRIVEDLRRQYLVVEVNPDNDYPDDLDALLAVGPSTLPQDALDRFVAYVAKGKPTLIVDDPFPQADPSLSPAEPKGAGRNPFMGGPPPKEKGDIEAALASLGIRWRSREVVFDRYNPHKGNLQRLPPEFVFVGVESGADRPFNPDDVATAGLQEVVALYPGHVSPAQASGGPEFTPLLKTTAKQSGTVPFASLVQRSMFGGIGGMNRNPSRRETLDAHVLAARVRGDLPPPPGGPASAGRKVNAVFLADADCFGDQFFSLREMRGSRQVEGLDFDNVTLVLNLLDGLAGDDAFVALRKRRPRHRTLATIEGLVKEFQDRNSRDVQAAEEEAEAQLGKAQARLDEAVRMLRERKDLDDRAKNIMVRQREEVENRRLEVERGEIEGRKQKAIRASRLRMEGAVRRVQNGVRVLAVVLPPIPALALAVVLFGLRMGRRRERTTA